MNSWFQYNKSSAVAGGIGIVLFLGIAGLGVYYSLQESDTYAKIERAKSSIDSMARKPLPPTDKVLEESTVEVEKYETQMSAIRDSYASFQESSALTHVDAQSFQNALKAESKAWQDACKEKGITVANEAKWMGFDSYQASAPPANASTTLHFQKAGIENFLNTMMANGVLKFSHVYRPALPIEKPQAAGANADREEAGMGNEAPWQYMPFEVTFEGDRKSVAAVLNAISKSDKYLYVLSAMRVKNEKQTAPAFSLPKAADPKPAATQTGISLAVPGVAAPTQTAEANAAPAPPVVEEIMRQVLGSEKVIVHMAVNLVHFKQPAAPEGEAGDGDEEESTES